jgi:hypothetical protein
MFRQAQPAQEARVVRVIRSNATAQTPEVVFNLVENSLSITGECYPENALDFFAPLLDRLKRHFARGDVKTFRVTMEIHYVNTMSTKALQNVLATLDAEAASGANIEVVWKHDPEDDALEELGHDLLDEFKSLRGRMLAETRT